MSRRSVSALVAVQVVAATAQAQFVVSPRAGIVHHLDGRVLVEDRELNKDAAQFRWVGEGEVLRTDFFAFCADADWQSNADFLTKDGNTNLSQNLAAFLSDFLDG